MDEQLFGKYRLVRRLAFGGMAEIFLARLVGDEGFQKSVVVKRILPQFSADLDFTRMFVDEAVLAARLTHPNVAQVYDFGQVDDTYFITMEHVDGTDLRKLIRAATERNRRLSPVEVAAIGEGIARGLSYVHSVENDDGQPLGIVHRDISPHNVMLSRAGDVKIMDFGIAKAAARATQTATGTIKGKLAYMAPEQALGEVVDKLSDQFAVGLVLWECLAGRRLFEGDSEPELMSRVAAGRVRKLKDFVPDVPDELDRAIMRTLSVERALRYPDLRDLDQDLANFRFGLGSAGAVRLSTLMDELIPRERKRSSTERGTVALGADQSGSGSARRHAGSGSGGSEPSRPAGTAVLPPQSTSTNVPERDLWAGTAQLTAEHQSDPSLSMQSGWSHGVEITDPTHVATPAVAPEPFAATRITRGGVVQLAPESTAVPTRRHGRALLGAGVAIAAVLAVAAAFVVRNGGPSRATLVIESDPPGAMLLVSATPDASPLPTGLVTPAPIRGHAVGEAVRWRVEMPGMTPHERTTTLTKDVQRETIVLEKLPVVTPPPAPQLPAPTPVTALHPEPESEQPPTPRPDTPSRRDAVKQQLVIRDSSKRVTITITKAERPEDIKKGIGYLSVTTNGPWVDVTVNEKRFGKTPLKHVEVPAGLITIKTRSINGFTRTSTADVPAGSSADMTVDTN